MDIVGFVSEKVGIDKEQAESAVGILLKFAKDKLGDNFDKIAGYIPGAEDMIAKAPEGGGIGSAIGGLAKSLIGGGEKVQGLADMAASFTQSGLSADKIPEAASAVSEWVGDKGGDEVKSLLGNVFS